MIIESGRWRAGSFFRRFLLRRIVFATLGRMKSVVPGGFLVAVEGIDGAGKTTVSALLAQFFGERGLCCAYSKEPTGLSFGRQLRESAKTGRLKVEDELDFFLKDRIDHFQRAIGPALQAGAVVILDRYYWSTAAYQGARGVDPLKIIAENEAHVPRPDLVFLLDVAPETGLERVRVRGDIPNEFEKVAALANARSIFRDLQDAFGSFSVCIDTRTGLRDVHQKAQRELVSAIEGQIAIRNGDPTVSELLRA